MIVENSKSGTVEVVGEPSKTATIDGSQIRKLTYMLTEGLYSDAQSAVIVELANNGVDSVVESGKDPITHPVIVSLTNSSYNKFFLSIQDRGIGMDKEFFENRFMNLLDSTKGDKADQIGFFGIGGKSWASLKKTVTFTIVKDGKKCKYLCWKGEELIDYDIILEEDTDEENGVLFEMPISNYSEYSQFISKAKQKLAYYDTVVLMIEGTVWENKIYRNELFQYNTTSPYTALHMCLKDVVYTIDFNKLGITSMDIPIALRFGLTDGINVTPSRESILYSRETIELIKNRIIDVANFFKEKWEEKVKDPVNFYDNFSYISTKYKVVCMPSITLEIHKLEEFGGPFKAITCESMNYITPSWYKTNIYTLLGFMESKAEYKHNGVWKTSKLYTSLESKWKDKEKVYLIDVGVAGYIKEYIKEISGVGNIYVSLSSPRKLGWYKRNVLGREPKSKWRAIIQEYQTVENNIIRDFCIDIRGIDRTPEYAEWLINRKESVRRNRGNNTSTKLLNKQAGEVTIGYSRPTMFGNNFTFEKKTYKIADLVKTNHLVIVFDDVDREKAKLVASVVNKEKVAIIGKREFSKIKHLHQFKYYNNMIEEGSKPFRRLATALLAQETLEEYTNILGRKNEIVSSCLSHMTDDVKFLREYISSNSKSGNIGINTIILETARELNLWDGEVIVIINKLKVNMQTFDFIQYLEVPNWNELRKKEVKHLINQMLLFRKKYYEELKDYSLVYTPPKIEEVIPPNSDISSNKEEYIIGKELIDISLEEEVEGVIDPEDEKYYPLPTNTSVEEDIEQIYLELETA